MLSDPMRLFRQRVAEASHRLGRNAAKIVDEVLSEAFPDTSEAAAREGADTLLRTGAISWVKRELGQVEDEGDQLDFAEVCGDFADRIEPLRKRAYFVPSLDEFVTVGRMIAEPELLDEARKFTRQKGEETISEADRLDALYEAVIAKANG